MSRRRIRDKRDRVRQLRVFCEVARTGSITRAAERLELTQPAVSMRVRELEHELDAVLLERGLAGVTPSAAGERLYALAEPLVRGLDELFADPMRACDSESAQAVRVAASRAAAAFVLPRHIGRFRDRYPEIVVVLDTLPVREGLRSLLDEEADFVLGAKDAAPEEAFVYHEILTYTFKLITPLDHPLAGRERVSAQTACAYSAVVPPASAYSRQFGGSVVRTLGTAAANIVAEISDWGLLKRHVEAGVGISVVPSLCLSETDQLCVIDIEEDGPPRSFGVFTRRDRRLTSAARRFLEVLIPNPRLPPADE